MNFDSEVFLTALTSQGFRDGAVIAIALTVVSQLTAVAIGLILAVMRESRLRLLRGASWTYVWIFRAIPTLVQLLFVWNALPQLFPVLKEEWFSAFIAAWLALSMNEGAYMAEIIRGGLLAVDEGQQLAARALGMTPFSVFRRVVLPQVVRVIIPPTANEFITMLKITSLASAISLRELLTYTQQEISITFRFAEFYAAAAIYYLVIVSVFMALQAVLERRFLWSSQRGGAGRLSTALRGMGAR
ncbi:MAG TPA: amino acid ABC transporter permease [Candidatus Limnocylindrales bacterium]|nr:amino acid ABC transporter permease [Candidatus Limnocylindrales bacterium]